MNPIELQVRRLCSRYPALKPWFASARRLLQAGRGRSAAEHWDANVEQVEAATARGWLDVEWVETEHIRPLISGDPEISYLQHFSRTHLAGQPAERWLSLGCGGGNFERGLFHLGMVAGQVDAIDASPASVELARDLAAREGLAERISYHVADADQLELEPAAYDVVAAKMSLHHFDALEHVYEQVSRSLRGGGLFLFNEFVGPTRFQWTDLQLEHMNQLLHTLPKSLRRRLPVVRIQRPRVADLIAQDPSEAIRSAEIMPLLENHFRIVELKPYGGTLLHILLDHLLPVLDLDNTEDQEILSRLMQYERDKMASGELPSDFVYCVATPRE